MRFIASLPLASDNCRRQLGPARSCATRRVSASPDACDYARDDPCQVNVRLTPRERAALTRLKKLDYISTQVSAGELVIREMTLGERERWARQHAAVEAKLTPAERTRRAAALKVRRATERHRSQVG
jgi:hypothetical protein